jgi:NAD(P)H-dependent FMN reductase
VRYPPKRGKLTGECNLGRLAVRDFDVTQGISRGVAPAGPRAPLGSGSPQWTAPKDHRGTRGSRDQGGPVRASIDAVSLPAAAAGSLKGMKEQLRIGIIIGSTRPDRHEDTIGIERKGDVVGRWVYHLAAQRRDAVYALIDLKEVALALFDGPLPPILGQYAQDHTKAWSKRIESFDGYVFVTPEYNASTSAAMKNAIDFLHAEWRNKAAGFVGYGASGGTQAVANLRTVLSGLDVAHVTPQVALALYTDFIELRHFKPGDHQPDALAGLLDQLLAWAAAMRAVRVTAE